MWWLQLCKDLNQYQKYKVKDILKLSFADAEKIETHPKNLVNPHPINKLFNERDINDNIISIAK